MRNHRTIEEPVRGLVLFHQKEEWEITTSPRLPPGKHVDGEKPLPAPLHTNPDRPTARVYHYHGMRRRMGVQPSANNTRGPMEGYLHNGAGTFPTPSNVLRADQLARNLPNYDEHPLPRPDR